MSSPKVLFGFHAVGVRLKTAPKSIIEIYYEATRRDARMRQFLDRAREAGARLIEADSVRIAKLAGSHGHQGVAARVEPVKVATSLDELLEDLEAAVREGNPNLPRFDSSCFDGQYVTGIEPGYFERIEQMRSDEAKRKRRVG